MTGKQRAKLRGLANTIEPILYIGKEGITENTVKECYDALEARELIKGSVQQGAPLDAREALTALSMSRVRQVTRSSAWNRTTPVLGQ